MVLAITHLSPKGLAISQKVASLRALIFHQKSRFLAQPFSCEMADSESTDSPICDAIGVPLSQRLAGYGFISFAKISCYWEY